VAKKQTDSSARSAQQLLTQLNKEARQKGPSVRGSDVRGLEPTKLILRSSTAVQFAFLRAAADEIGMLRKKLGDPRRNEAAYLNMQDLEGPMIVISWLLVRKIPWKDADLRHLVRRTADVEFVCVYGRGFPYLSKLITLIEKRAEKKSPDAAMKTELGRLVKALQGVGNAVQRKLIARIHRLIEGASALPLQPGEAWSDQALAHLGAMKETDRDHWTAVIAHCQSAAGRQPSAEWASQAESFVDRVGRAGFKKHVLSWFPLVDKPRTRVVERWEDFEPDPNLLIIEAHADILKGLAWCCGLFGEDRELARALAAMAVSAYKKVPRIGPRAVKIGNACINALGMMQGLDAIGQLAVLKTRVKFRPAQTGIDQAFAAAAARAGVPRDDLEEMSVPTYGLTQVGRLEETFLDFTAQLHVDGDGSSKLLWIKQGNKAQRSVPAAVQKNHADAIGELKKTAKDIQKMLPAQRERLDRLYRLQKSWPLATWQAHYLHHPLVGILARRLIWDFTTGNQTASGIWHDGQIVGHNDKPLSRLGDKTGVSLWDPIGRPVDDVLSWREWLEGHELRQPFKQAHREIYLLTDAERETAIYSNRFAGHVLKQHQFHALCGVRDWSNKLRLLVDQDFPPASLDLPAWNLRAEFWVQGAGDDYGTDTNDTGTFYYLTTDQVRFYRRGDAQRVAHGWSGGYRPPYDQPDAEPLALDTIPPLVFCEVMRDVDLFVGVASIGNDPNWSNDRRGRFQGYWQNYAFGNLSQPAETRKAVLQKLLPRLKIAGNCSLSDKFLQVRGDRRSYKIHLGSGNILMTPNDQGLCIVAKPSSRATDSKIFLPFEGDGLLSQIISKALLLAEDSKIADPTILRQIVRE
jgi:hypothetical protein